jgi:hypothetical protein
MRWGRHILFLVALCPLLSANTISFNGTFYGQKTIDRYCIKPLQNTSFEMRLTSTAINCLSFLDHSGVLGKQCKKSSYLYVNNLKKGVVYYIIEARLKNSNLTRPYTLWTNATNSIEVGICPSQALANASGMSGEQMSFMLGLSGFTIAVILFGSITHIILSIKEW